LSQETVKVLCATVYNKKLGYDLIRWGEAINKQTRQPDAIHIEPDPDDPTKYWNENVSLARERCRQRAIAQGFDYLWFSDVDTIPPPHALETLLKTKVDVACGRYYHKVDKNAPMFWYYRLVPPEERDAVKKRYGKPTIIEDWFYLGEETMEINKAGTGCMLISRPVFQRIAFQKKIPRNCTEDVLYSIMVNAMGYKIFAVPSVTCDHIGPVSPKLKEQRA
jgi:GT2 family glycosyltransferase